MRTKQALVQSAPDIHEFIRNIWMTTVFKQHQEEILAAAVGRRALF
jgi:hypothetical protein